MPDTTTLLHYEDFPAEETITFGAHEVTREEIVEFAREFDPQPFHLDEEAARDSMIGVLCASGWHTLAMLNRMMCDAYVCQSASMGSFGCEEIRWLKPVLVGDVLSVRRTTLAKRISDKRPGMGIVTFRWEVLDQAGEVKLDAVGVNLFKTRAAS